MKRIFFSALVLLISCSVTAQGYEQLSIDFLNDIKDGKNTDAYMEKFKAIDHDKFLKEIDTDPEKFAFWMNFYNGMIQHILKKHPEYFKDKSARGDFFTNEQVPFSDQLISFDMIEHGVLRKGLSKYSKGYFSNPFGSDWHEPYEVEEIDWRIHFALNCGAKDCPPVRIYESKKLNEQIDASAQQYMDAQVIYQEEKEQVKVPALMNWFSGDFGGSDGVENILIEYNQIPNGTSPDIEYKDYDWTLKLGMFYKD